MQPTPVPGPTPQAAAGAEAKGFSGAFQDPATLAATGLILAVLFAVVAGLFNVVSDMGTNDVKERLLGLTVTVDVGDVALLGLAVALLLLTPDPPGGVPRSLLMQSAAVLSGVIALFGVVRAIVQLAYSGDFLGRIAGALGTLGVTIAAFTVAFYAAKESLAKEDAATAA